jgi:hypothetical protein
MVVGKFYTKILYTVKKFRKSKSGTHKKKQQYPNFHLVHQTKAKDENENYK